MNQEWVTTDDFTFNYSQRLTFWKITFVSVRPKWMHHWNWSWWLNNVITRSISSSFFLSFCCCFFFFFLLLVARIYVHRNSVCHCYYIFFFSLQFLHTNIAPHRIPVCMMSCLHVCCFSGNISYFVKCDNATLAVVLCFSSIDHFHANVDDQSHCARRICKPRMEKIIWKKKKKKTDDL